MSSSSIQGVFLATAMAAVSGTVILFALRLQKSPSSSLFQVNTIPILRPCLSSGEKKGDKKKKRVRFAEDVVDPRSDNEEFRRQHTSNFLRKISKVENRGMPANRAALYRGIIRDRVIHQKKQPGSLPNSSPRMASTGSQIAAIATSKLNQGSVLYFHGFKQACSLHKVAIFCYRSRSLLIRTGQCFLFNGFIFLGSVYILKSFLVPMLEWILPDRCPHVTYEEVCRYGVVLTIYSTMRKLMIQLIYLLWFYPLYMSSIILSNIWYNDIAKHGFVAMGKYKHSAAPITGEKETLKAQVAGSDKSAGLGGIMIGVGEQVYSVLLLSFFFLQVFVTGFIPYAGKALNFLLLSWMYAYYCFEYKWNLSEVTLDRRLDFFESNWAFFAGFGSPCVLAIFFFPPLESYAVMATLFPLFVLTATGSDADDLVFLPRKQWLGAGLGRVPIFCGADYVSMKVLSFFPLKSLEQNQGKKAF